MTVRRIDEFTIALEGVCPVADAEVLRQHLVSAESAKIDLTACEHAHTAVVQVLLASFCWLPNAKWMARQDRYFSKSSSSVELPVRNEPPDDKKSLRLKEPFALSGVISGLGFS